jgi:small basic protein (TIGR04137 family)
MCIPGGEPRALYARRDARCCILLAVSGCAPSADLTKLTIGNSDDSVLRCASTSTERWINNIWNLFMSQHRSLRAVATMGGKRNVLKRFERVELLKRRGQWKVGDRVTGLRKTKPDA